MPASSNGRPEPKASPDSRPAGCAGRPSPHDGLAGSRERIRNQDGAYKFRACPQSSIRRSVKPLRRREKNEWRSRDTTRFGNISIDSASPDSASFGAATLGEYTACVYRAEFCCGYWRIGCGREKYPIEYQQTSFRRCYGANSRHAGSKHRFGVGAGIARHAHR